MPELKTDEAEAALAEHVAATREGYQSPDDTPYSGTVTDFRAELMVTSRMWSETERPYREQVHAALKAVRGTGKPPVIQPAVADAHCACMMAASYSYTLAAMLGYAEKNFGHATAARLACLADNILMNGDDGEHNADVTPAAEVTTDA